MIRLVIFALVLTIFCKLFLNQTDVTLPEIDTVETPKDDSRELVKDSQVYSELDAPSS